MSKNQVNRIWPMVTSAIFGFIIAVIIFLLFQGGLKKHIVLEKKEYYFLPVFRGLYFISILIIIFCLLFVLFYHQNNLVKEGKYLESFKFNNNVGILLIIGFVIEIFLI